MSHQECLHSDSSFSRVVCACGSMHFYCADCGEPLDDCSED